MTENPTMERCQLAPGLSVSRILTGLWQVADMERDDRSVDLDAAAAAMQPYVDAGYTSFDMADHYGSSELIVGRHLATHRGDEPVQALTKWVPKPGPVNRQDVRQAVELSLERLQSPSLDLLQFHAWSYPDPAWLDCLFYLQELKEKGLIRHLGLTNFDAIHLDMVLHSGIEAVSNQVSFSLIDQRAAGALSKVCGRHGIKLLAYGTLAGGLLSERWLGADEPDVGTLATWSLMKYKRFIDAAGGWKAFQGLLKTLGRVARQVGASIPHVASRYILEQPAVGGIIIGARLGESEHITDNLRLFDFSLDEENKAAIATALTTFQPIPGDCGDEYRRPPYLTASGDLSHHFDDLFPTPYEVRESPDTRTRALSGTPWEEFAGYSRAVRQGNRILVSGTTATHLDRVIGGSDPAAQTHFVIDKIEGAVQSLGGRLEDIVRTRIFVNDVEHWEPVARAHGTRFAGIQPANTLVQAKLIGDEYLVEMEADAIVSEDRTPS